MDVAGVFADIFRDGGEEGDDVVVDFGFDFIDTVDVEVAFFAQGFCCAFGHCSHFCHFFESEGFNL